jgi:NAD(P)-dependent dehydrogenase (short-subunit alcohol dehydrogenase family)
VKAQVKDDGLNLLINNAGIILKDNRNLETVTPEAMRECYDVNTIAPLMITRVSSYKNITCTMMYK